MGVVRRDTGNDLLHPVREHLELVLQDARMVAWEWDPARDVVITTRNLQEVCGISEVGSAEVRRGLVHPDDLPAHRALVERALETGGKYRSEFRIMRPDTGEVVWLEEYGTAARDEMGRLTGLAGIATDISERKRGEQAVAFLTSASQLLASSLDYETTLANVAQLSVPVIADWCAIDIVTDDGGVRRLAAAHTDPEKVELARELDRRYPYDPSAPTGVPQVLRTGEPDLAADITDEMLAAVIEDAELLAILRDLGLRSSMIVPLLARGRTLGAITFIAAESGRHFGADDLALAQNLATRAAMAIDNARLYEEARRREAERSATLSQMADGVILCDVNGTVTFMNDAARSLYGADFTGESFAAYGPGSGLLDEHGEPYPLTDLPLRRAFADGEVTISSDARVRRPDGTEVAVQRNATPILAPDGTRLGAVMTARDVTAQRDLDREKDEFLTTVAHDLKNPLTTVKVLAQMLGHRMLQDPATESRQIVEGLERIDRTATQMANLIEHLLDMSRLQMGGAVDLSVRECDLLPLLAGQVADVSATAPAHTVSLQTSETALIGDWDVDRLERVFSNLLSNAIKYSPDGGAVLVTASRDESAGRDWALVTVADHGLGVPEDELPHIFERFHRGRNVPQSIPGTGIGLAGSRQIVEQHGGSIALETEEGSGTTVTVRLPMRAGQANA